MYYVYLFCVFSLHSVQYNYSIIIIIIIISMTHFSSYDYIFCNIVYVHIS